MTIVEFLSSPNRVLLLVGSQVLFLLVSVREHTANSLGIGLIAYLTLVCIMWCIFSVLTVTMIGFYSMYDFTLKNQVLWRCTSFNLLYNTSSHHSMRFFAEYNFWRQIMPTLAYFLDSSPIGFRIVYALTQLYNVQQELRDHYWYGSHMNSWICILVVIVGKLSEV